MEVLVKWEFCRDLGMFRHMEVVPEGFRHLFPLFELDQQAIQSMSVLLTR
jgi:hypothetical protein